MAFWEEPPQYMIERELRLRRTRLDEVCGSAEDEPACEDAAPGAPSAPSEEEEEELERSSWRFLAKEKLMELGKYVASHVYRKIRAKWPHIRELFNTRANSRTGRKASVRLSAIVSQFCTPAVNVSMDEVVKLLTEIGLPAHSVTVSGKLCALKHEAELFGMDLTFAEQFPEEMISEARLMDMLFSEVPEQRASELELAEADYRMVQSESADKRRRVKLIEDKAKKRAARSTVLFEETLAELQVSRGPVSYRGPRLNMLCEMGRALSLAAYQERVRQAMAVVSQHRLLLDLIGPALFSERYVSFLADPGFDPPPVWLDATEGSAVVVPAAYFHRVHLGGATSLVQVCRALLTGGRGLGGLSHVETVELLQALAATRLQTVFRMCRASRPYARARRMWRRNHRLCKQSHLKAWARRSHAMTQYRERCLRKLVAWRRYTALNIARRELFRLCFWPVLVWRKYAVASAVAKSKTRFLVSRVYPAYLLLHTYRAWHRYSLDRLLTRRRADAHYMQRLRRKQYRYFQWLREGASKGILLRASRVKARLYDVRMKIMMRKLSYFQIWRGYAMFRSAVKTRVARYVTDFRTLLLGAAPKNMYERYWMLNLAAARRKEAARRRASARRRRQAERRRLKHMAFDDSTTSDTNFSPGFADNSDSMELADAEEEDAEEEEEDEEEEELGPARVEAKVMSTWRTVREPEAYDVDEDGEADPCHVPAALLEVYERCAPSLEDELFDPHLRGMSSKFVLVRYDNLARNFRAVEAMALLDEAMVFHRAASKAFRNLQIYSIVRIRARRAISSYRLRLLGKVFRALYTWIYDVQPDVKSEAEKLSIAAKTARFAHMERRRALQKALLAAKTNSPVEGVDGSLTLDLLELDREERFEEVTQLRRMIALSDSYEQHAYTLVQRNVGEPGRAERDFKRGAVTGVFANESAELMSAREKELHFAHIFKLEAARRLVDATHKVFEEALVGHTLKIAKILFRHLRVPLLKKRSIYMKHRAILKNYIRICKRLTSLSESVYKYQLKRKQWVALNRWIKLLEMSYLETTPGLILRLKRGVAMYRRFSDSLADQGFSVTSFRSSYRDGSLHSACQGWRALFLRWVMFAQEARLFRMTGEKATDLYLVRLLRRCFDAIKYNRRNFVLADVPGVGSNPALERRTVDLEQAVKRFISRRRVGLFTRLQCLARVYRARVVQNARTTMTFRQFIKQLNSDVHRRLNSEMTVVADAFEDRGSMKFVDVAFNEPVPASMLRLPGFLFSDPQVQEDSGVPGGYLLSTISICLREGSGIAGLQFSWRGDRAPDIIGPRRGLWSGSAQTVHKFVVPAGDFIRGVEYHYEGTTTYAMRLHLYWGGWTAWVGARNSLSSLTLSLDVDDAPLPSELDPSDYTDSPHLALKKRYIIGFTGVETSFLATGLGIVVRTVETQHIFSYMWLDEALQRKAASVEAAKRHERQKKERQKKETRKTHKISLTSIIQSHILPQLSKAKKWAGGSAGEVAHLVPQPNVLEEFLDCSRMRAKEVQSALARAEALAVRLWTDAAVARCPELAALSTLRIISGLTRWFFAVISKRLIPDFPQAALGTQMVIESMQIHNKADSDVRVSMMNTSMVEKNGAKMKQTLFADKYLLSPEDRKMKREFEGALEQKRSDALATIRAAETSDAAAFEMYKRGRALLPRLQLTRFVCANYRMKVEAARHKVVLLERMTMSEVKASLSGAHDRPAHTLSAENLSVVQNALAESSRRPTVLPVWDELVRSIEEESENVRAATIESITRAAQEGSTFRTTRSIPNPVDPSRARPVVAKSSSDALRRPRLTAIPHVPALSKEPITDET